MIFILFEIQIIVVYDAFYLTKIHFVVPKLLQSLSGGGPIHAHPQFS